MGTFMSIYHWEANGERRIFSTVIGKNRVFIFKGKITYLHHSHLMREKDLPLSPKLSSKFSSLNADFYTIHFSGPNYCNLKALWCFPQCCVCDCLPDDERAIHKGCLFVLFIKRLLFSYIKLLISMHTLGFHYFKHNLALLVSTWSSPFPSEPIPHSLFLL